MSARRKNYAKGQRYVSSDDSYAIRSGKSDPRRRIEGRGVGVGYSPAHHLNTSETLTENDSGQSIKLKFSEPRVAESTHAQEYSTQAPPIFQQHPNGDFGNGASRSDTRNTGFKSSITNSLRSSNKNMASVKKNHKYHSGGKSSADILEQIRLADARIVEASRGGASVQIMPFERTRKQSSTGTFHINSTRSDVRKFSNIGESSLGNNPGRVTNYDSKEGTRNNDEFPLWKSNSQGGSTNLGSDVQLPAVTYAKGSDKPKCSGNQ